MNHWSQHARTWSLLGPPLRPSPEDTAIATGEIRPADRVLLLGATPELAPHARVALDRSRAILGAVLPAGTALPVVGDWLAMPLADRSFDVAVGDGCLTTLRFPDDYAAFARELARVVRPGGRVVLRLFVLPDRDAGPVEILDTMHALKWRVAMAIVPADRTVAVTAIRDAFVARFPDRDALPWPRAVTDMIDNYATSPARYSFPTLAETCEALAPLVLERVAIPASYPLAERCPTIVCRVAS